MFDRNFRRAALFAATVLAMPIAAFGQVAISPAAPRALDAVRLQVTHGGTFIYVLDKTAMSMSGNTIEVTMALGAALSPPPPPRTDEVLLGQLPAGTYTINVREDDGNVLAPIGSITFTVDPKAASRDTEPFADFTDLWWNANQSGWGLNITQHASGNLFVTWFAYGSNGQPSWYVVPGGRWTQGHIFQGTAYRTTGPLVSDTFDPSLVTRTVAGIATLQFDTMSPNSAIFTMQLDGQTFSSAITRQPY